MKFWAALALLGGFALGFFATKLQNSAALSQPAAVPHTSESAALRPDSDSLALAPTTVAAASRWASLESTDYHQYAVNLRAAGCPKGTIHDIIRPLVESSFAPRFAALNHSGKFIADPFARAKSGARERGLLGREIDRVLYEELGIQRPIRATALFTAEEEARILEALKAYPTTAVDRANPESMALSQSNRTARIQYLSAYFPPEQLTYYKLDREFDGPRIASLLRGMQPSKPEFLAVHAAVEGMDLTFRNGSFDSQVELALKGALGPDRYSLLHELHQREYIEIRTFAVMNRLSDDTANQLIQLRKQFSQQSPEAYRSQAMNLLQKPKLVDSFLRDSSIHPQVK
jgi:hypothetical protein